MPMLTMHGLTVKLLLTKSNCTNVVRTVYAGSGAEAMLFSDKLEYVCVKMGFCAGGFGGEVSLLVDVGVSGGSSSK